MQLWQTTRDATSQRLTTPQVVPFLLEAKLKELGASYTKAKENWGVHALLDARAPFPLVTGQNPASSGLTAELVVEALGGHKAGAGVKIPKECEMHAPSA